MVAPKRGLRGFESLAQSSESHTSSGESFQSAVSNMDRSFSKQRLTQDQCPSHHSSQNKGFWSQRTFLEKSLCFLSGILFIMSLGLITALIVLVSNTNQHENLVQSASHQALDESSTKPDSDIRWPLTPNEVCETESCQEAAKTILKNMDSSIKPCDDFYSYACGGWMKTHKIPEDKGRYGSFDILGEEVDNRLRRILQESPRKSDSNPVAYAAHLYQACNDNEMLERRGKQPLVSLLDSIGGWPIEGTNSSFDPKTYNWKYSLTKLISYGFKILVSASVAPDPNNTMSYIVTLDQPELGVGRTELINFQNDTEAKKVVDAYSEYIKKTSLYLGADDTKELRNTITDLIDFEVKLASISTSPEDRRDHFKTYNKMTFQKLNSLTGDINWLTIINKLYSQFASKIQMVETDYLVVQDMDYIENLSAIMSQSKLETIANYLGWRLLQETGFMSTSIFRDNEFNFEKVVQGIEKEEPLWRRCLNFVSEELPYAVSRKYIEKYFTSKKQDEAVVLVENLRQSFSVLLKNNNWVDEATKSKAFSKLENLLENVGYPLWLLNDEDLSNYYNLTFTVDPSKAFESSYKLRSHLSKLNFEQINDPVNMTTNWPMSPTLVNAAYEPTQNSITIPAAILDNPFFRSDVPGYVNFGGIGVVIGHEITHGFDDEGSQFDEKGNLRNWWTKATREKFNERAQCFINEYSAVVDDRVNMHLNGNNTLGENIADNGGIRESFNAYKIQVNKTGPPMMLPDLPNLSPDQLFFMSFANTWCSLVRPEKLRQMILYDPHSPPKFRVNVVTSNFDEFGKAFKCKESDGMYRKEKCILW